MDEYNISMLSCSKDEYTCRILNILTPLMVEGIKSIFNEAYELCRKNDEHDKYLMTFQNFISRIPKWNQTIIENEKKRIIEKSGCSYLEDLITCVYIIQLKILTATRVGQKQKKIDINILKLEEFIHKVYINIARKVYKNVYLFELNVPPLQTQKYNRELEIIVQECILNTIRDSIPIETILKAYINETYEEDVYEEIKEQIINSVDNSNDNKKNKQLQEITNDKFLDDKNQTTEKQKIDNGDFHIKNANGNENINQQIKIIVDDNFLNKEVNINKEKEKEKEKEYEKEDEKEDENVKDITKTFEIKSVKENTDKPLTFDDNYLSDDMSDMSISSNNSSNISNIKLNEFDDDVKNIEEVIIDYDLLDNNKEDNLLGEIKILN